MKWIGIVLILVFVSVSHSRAQETGDSLIVVTEKKKLSKEEKKAAKEAKREERELRKSERQLEEFERRRAALLMIKQLMTDSLFVLEANTLYDRNGRTFPASPSINFMAISRDSLVLQLGSNNAIGPNGVGGITLEGIINKYEVSEGPGPNNVSVNLNVRSAILGLATVNIKVSGDGIFWATLNGSWRQQIRMKGIFRSWESSTIFKGRTTRLLYGPY